jgi:hypothetical protein
MDDSTNNRTLPEHWPPLAGDTWKIPDGTTWMARVSNSDPSRTVIEPTGEGHAYSDLPFWGPDFAVKDFAKLNPVLTYRQGRDVAEAKEISGTAKDLTAKLDRMRERATDSRLDGVAEILRGKLRPDLVTGGAYSLAQVTRQILDYLDVADRKAKGDFGPELTGLRETERALRDALTQAVNDLSRAELSLSLLEGDSTEANRNGLRMRTGSLLASGARIATLMKDFQASAKEITG